MLSAPREAYCAGLGSSLTPGTAAEHIILFPHPPGRVAGRKLFVTSPCRFRLEYAGHSIGSESRVMYRLNHNHEIIELLLKLKDYEEPYPNDLFAARRHFFIALIRRYVPALVRL